MGRNTAVRSDMFTLFEALRFYLRSKVMENDFVDDDIWNRTSNTKCFRVGFRINTCVK